jgi:hypothetical protein
MSYFNLDRREYQIKLDSCTDTVVLNLWSDSGRSIQAKSDCKNWK